MIVGLPRCNEPRAILVETLDAIDASTYRPTRTIIVDNGDKPMDDELVARIGAGNVTRPGRNIGCAGAWNRIHELAGGVRVRLWQRVVILNADCAVAPDTFATMMAIPAPAVVLAYGFGCFFVDDLIRDRVGGFDEEFYPAYFEDADYRYRMKLAGVTPVEWPIEPADSTMSGRSRAPSGIVHGSHDPDGYQGWRGDKLSWFWERYEANRQRYVKKWGGEPGQETLATPFGV